MERKRAKSFEQTYVIEGDEVERLDQQSMTAVLGELAGAMEPPARDHGNGPDSGDTVTMNVLVATSVDEMLLSPEDDETADD